MKTFKLYVIGAGLDRDLGCNGCDPKPYPSIEAYRPSHDCRRIATELQQQNSFVVDLQVTRWVEFFNIDLERYVALHGSIFIGRQGDDQGQLVTATVTNQKLHPTIIAGKQKFEVSI